MSPPPTRPSSRPPSSLSRRRCSSIASNSSGLSNQGAPNQNLRRTPSSTSFDEQTPSVSQDPVSRLRDCLKTVDHLIKSRAETNQEPLPINDMLSLYILKEDLQQALYHDKVNEHFPSSKINRNLEVAAAAKELKKRVGEMTQVLKDPGSLNPEALKPYQLKEILLQQCARVFQTMLWKYLDFLPEYTEYHPKPQTDPGIIDVDRIVEVHIEVVKDAFEAWDEEIRNLKISANNSIQFFEVYDKLQDYQSVQTRHAITILQKLQTARENTKQQSASELYKLLDLRCQACKACNETLKLPTAANRPGTIAYTAKGAIR